MGKSETLLFFVNDTATPEIYTLSLHDALPISHSASGRRAGRTPRGPVPAVLRPRRFVALRRDGQRDRERHDAGSGARAGRPPRRAPTRGPLRILVRSLAR